MEDVQVVALLVRRCVAGDAAAWEEIVQRYHRRIYNICYRFAGSADDAQDLTQEFFRRFLERKPLANVQPAAGKFRSFLLACLKNFLANEWDRARTAKRGAGHQIISWDEHVAENQFTAEPATGVSPVAGVLAVAVSTTDPARTRDASHVDAARGARTP